eukprot:TRINITY_DN50133_c0_g1_i1.p1 TRINITY_DN50133_c0_g1~~TRINITY_DN50133_c0_g1_i1.p1  ORF type:complete len:345 (+),score=77.30 TRINITY_DN50133_c0_g1_i1:178-1212(+)
MSLMLNSGRAMPTLGLGTFKATTPGEVGSAVRAALQAGYRLIDCAAGYGNQPEIGDALTEAMASGTVSRDELFVVSKLFQTHHAWDGDASRCFETLDRTLAELQLEYLDLFLIHWPFGFAEAVLEKPPGTPQPLRLEGGSPNPVFTIKMEYTQTWAAMEAMVESGKVKSIGVSNFTREQLEHLCSVATIPPAVNQVELHPYCSQQELVKFCEKESIRVMGYSPLGSSAEHAPTEAGHRLLEHPVVGEIAQQRGKTAAQVLIRWGLQRYGTNLISIPKSSNPGRIEQNFHVTDWELTDADMERLDQLNCDFRYFVSYLKTPSNDVRWHDGVIETGTESDFVTTGS